MEKGTERLTSPTNKRAASETQDAEQISETDARVIRKIRRITDRGNNAEIRKKKDGTLTVCRNQRAGGGFLPSDGKRNGCAGGGKRSIKSEGSDALDRVDEQYP